MQEKELVIVASCFEDDDQDQKSCNEQANRNGASCSRVMVVRATSWMIIMELTISFDTLIEPFHSPLRSC